MIKREELTNPRSCITFQKYLADMETMPRTNFYVRYQEYMGLSDAELKAILEKSNGD